jgi:hypothetical protein
MDYEMQPYIVYVKVDDKNRIIAVNSSAFLTDLTDWVEIDSGFGDKYHHAQGNYFHLPIYDDRGICRYKLVDGKPAERTAEEMEADYECVEPQPSFESRVEILETKVDGEMADQREALNLLGVYA